MDDAGTEDGAFKDGEEKCYAGQCEGPEGTAAWHIHHNQRRDEEDYRGYAGYDTDRRGFAGEEGSMKLAFHILICAISQAQQ